MRQITAVRRFPVVLQVVILLALASGAYLYWRVSGGFQPNWVFSRSGLTFGVGGVLGLVAGAIGFVVTAPTAAALGRLGSTIQRQDGPPTAEQAGELRRLQIVMLRAAQWIAALLLAAVTAMAVGRYM